MNDTDAPHRRPSWILIGIGTVLLVALLGYALVPSEICPKCHGFTIAHNENTVRGLPDASGMTPCSRCEGRSTVSRLNLWLNGDGGGD